MSKHKITTDNPVAFTFNKPLSTNPLEFKGIEKPKEVFKKTKSLNKNSEIFEYFFNQKINNSIPNNSKNNNNNSQDIFDPKNMKYSTPIKTLPQILTSDSQTFVSSLTSSSHSSPNILSFSSLAISGRLKHLYPNI
jgi:hypothetical protein